MTRVNYTAVVVAAVAAFAAAFGYYLVLGDQYAEVSAAAREAATAGPEPWTMLVEFARSLVVATVVAGLAAHVGIRTWIGAVLLAVVLWIGFPLVLWTGAVVHEDTPVRLAAIHAGDWLVKLLVIAVIVGAWRRVGPARTRG